MAQTQQEDRGLIQWLFGGAARDAGETVSARKRYNKYVRRQQEQGKEPLSFEEWRKQ